jgi:protein gp37
MADVFDYAAPDAWRISLIGLMQITPNLDWLLLTKRPQNIERMFYQLPFVIPDNIWLGTSVEDQARADERIPVLLDCGPCAIRFLSCEPLLGPIDLTNLHNIGFDALYGVAERSKKINWVIIGGESGPHCRPMQLEWARSLVAQCRAANIPVWVKQLGGYPNKREALLSLPEDLKIRELPI